jgi:hypothetical protein
MLDGKKSQVSRHSAAVGGPMGYQKQVRLSDAQQAKLVQRHRDGAFQKELARVRGAHRDGAGDYPPTLRSAGNGPIPYSH